MNMKTYLYIYCKKKNHYNVIMQYIPDTFWMLYHFLIYSVHSTGVYGVSLLSIGIWGSQVNGTVTVC